MKSLKYLKQSKKNNLLISHVFSYLLIGLMISEEFFADNIDISYYNGFMIILYLLIIYTASKLLKGENILSKKSLKIVFFIFYIIGITCLIYLNKDYESQFLRIFYFVPVILVSVNYGKKPGLLAVSFSSINIILLDFLLDDFNNLNLDLITICLLIWIAWVVGSYNGIQSRIQQEFEKLAETDLLTGLYNFAGFRKNLDIMMEEARRMDENLCLALLDLDNFKLYNDSLGHSKGDELLKNIAINLKKSLPVQAFSARYGGDEFVILLKGFTLEENLSIIKQTKRDIEKNLELPYLELLEEKPTLSIGLAVFPLQASNKKELFGMADYALYQSKATSKDQVRIYHEVLKNLSEESDEKDLPLINTMKTLLSIINAKDRYTYGHSERLARYAGDFAQYLDFDYTEKQNLVYGAFLHDIGKIEIERDILLKTEKLSMDEWEVIKKHPAIGAKMIAPLKISQEIMPMIRYHHENFDGSGYPEGLRGLKIPLSARILRILDSYDAMTSKRPYSSAINKEEALIEMKNCVGKQYDPDLLESFMDYINYNNIDKNLEINNGFTSIEKEHSKIKNWP